MLLFHRTDAAKSILQDGFKDRGRGGFLGVWLSDAPWMEPEVKGKQVVRLKIPVVAIREFETWDWAPSYRTFNVPARVLNRYRPFVLLSEADENRIHARRRRRFDRLVEAAGGLDAWTAREMEKDENDRL